MFSYELLGFMLTWNGSIPAWIQIFVLLKLIVYVKTKQLTYMTMMVFGLHRDHLGNVGIDRKIFLKLT